MLRTVSRHHGDSSKLTNCSGVKSVSRLENARRCSTPVRRCLEKRAWHATRKAEEAPIGKTAGYEGSSIGEKNGQRGAGVVS